MLKSIFFCWVPFLLFFSSISAEEAAGSKKICLNMIVKNESRVIRRCLDTVKHVIDYWVIVDTGSTDGTQDIIKEYMKEIPGELIERPWVDFGHNRSEALAFTKGKGDYVLFMDADEKLEYTPSFKSFSLDRDFYYVAVRGSAADFLSYNRFLLINNHLPWDWKDVLHEYLVVPEEAKAGEVLTQVTCFTDSDGFRAEDPRKYYKDAEVLEKALEKDPTNSRYVFYLAQSYSNAGDYDLALKNYEKRATMVDGWDKEVFWSLYVGAKIKEALKKSKDVIVESYCRAYQSDPSRAEPLYSLSEYFNREGNFTLAYALGSLASSIPKPDDEMYVQGWVYDFAIYCSLGFSALKLGKYEEASSLLQKALAREDLPAETRAHVQKNLNFVLSELSKRGV